MSTEHVRGVRMALLVAGAFLIGCPRADGQAVVDSIRFVDRGATGEVNLGTPRGSVGVIDFDGDGWVDLAFADVAGRPARLFRNVADPLRAGARNFEDVTAGSGLDEPDGTARGAGPVLAADFDGDGRPDIFLAVAGLDGATGVLYKNLGNGRFANVTSASGARLSGCTPDSASAVDFDRDGDLDILVCALSPGRRAFRLLLNNGDGTFTEAPELVPSAAPAGRVYAHGWSDFDGDGWPEGFILSTPPMLLRSVPNPTPSPGRSRVLVDIAAAAGFAHLGPAPMGIAFGDFDRDGLPDVAITDAVRGTYYQNRAGGTLVEVYPFATFFGWGASWLDADNDGWPDNYQAGSWSAASADRLWRNLGPTGPGGRVAWRDASAALNTTPLASQHAAGLDFNNDGRRDLVTVNPGGPGLFVSVYENVSATANHWITVRLVGGRGANTGAIGAVVRVTASGGGGGAGGATRVGEVACGTSAIATEDPRVHFGLGDAAVVDRVEVVWPRAGGPGAQRSVYPGPISADRVLTLSIPCPADFDASGETDANDLAAYINAWYGDLAGGTALAGFDGDAETDANDLSAYINAWYGEIAGGGC